MQDFSGYIWALQTVVGPLLLGIAIAFAIYHRRRRRKIAPNTPAETRTSLYPDPAPRPEPGEVSQGSAEARGDRRTH